jgi:hypothetical protein
LGGFVVDAKHLPGNPDSRDLLNENEPILALCDQCVHALKYADARTWKWFRDHRDRLKL